MARQSQFDLDAYFRRIGFDGDAKADLATLRALQPLHAAAFPFENLDPLLGRPVKLDLPSLQAKMIEGRRGGYCFEQNSLFRAALEAIGFQVSGLIGRVRWMVAADAPPTPRSHMVLRVELAEGIHLADVGFGGYLMMAPLRLAPGPEQPSPGGIMRLAARGAEMALQVRLPAGWKDCYVFTLEPAYEADYAVSNWFTSTHPDSLFRNNLLMERLTPDVRFSLFNRKFTRRDADGRVEERRLESAGELAETLETAFAVTPPAEPAAIFSRLSEN